MLFLAPRMTAKKSVVPKIKNALMVLALKTQKHAKAKTVRRNLNSI
jgi:hypothetical protein